MYEFEVIDKFGKAWAVNLYHKTCTCRVFQVDNFICPHGIAACRHRNFVVEDYISTYYTAENWASAYAGVIHPYGNKETWQIPEEVKQIIVEAPRCYKRQAGRPKKTRTPSQGEGDVATGRKCSRCRGVGHNRVTCRNPIPLKVQRAL